MLFLAEIMTRTRNDDWAAWKRWSNFWNGANKIETTVVDMVELPPTLKLVRILSERELRTQMGRVFPSKINELTLNEKRLDIYRAHLGEFPYDEWVLCKNCTSCAFDDLIVDWDFNDAWLEGDKSWYSLMITCPRRDLSWGILVMSCGSPDKGTNMINTEILG